MMKKKLAQTIMVQGTNSDAGKSMLVTGLCRVFKRQEIKVAPFKPQNMSLNCAVTSDGGEIGRAQAVQAIACGITAHSDFNPVLLKPSSDISSQVIIQGHPVKMMAANTFGSHKKIAENAILDSHKRLQKNYELIIAEGAGSPAEINLRKNDVANMGFAQMVDCPVILIADIDKGGVFAHLVGTLQLLRQSERDRIMGFVINKFRGDIGLLQSGLDWLENHTGKPVLGVLPYLQDFYLDAEDALAPNKNDHHPFKIVVPVFKRISNHTDFDPLQLHPEISFEFISINEVLPACDMVILPGSKNVQADLTLLKTSNFDKALLRHLRYGGKVFGICGGYQMLGNLIDDPMEIEGKGAYRGLGLLDIKTTLFDKKTLKRTTGTLLLNGKSSSFKGYEIHAGKTIVNSDEHLLSVTDEDGNHYQDGTKNRDDNVAGCYMHGIFDDVNTCNLILNWAGFDKASAIDIKTIRQQQINRLADILERHLDISRIKKILGMRV
jgi:adenosylcobyric acid synthase